MHAEKLAGLAPAVAEVRQLLKRLAQHDADLLVGAVGQEDVALLRVLREGDVPCRSRAQRVLGIERFLHERAVDAKHLHAIGLAIADIHEPVIRAFDAVNRVAELLCRRRVRIVLAEIRVVRLIAVGAPVALYLAGIGVEHSHALVEIAVGNIRLVGLRVDPDLRHSAKILEIVAAGVLARATHLHQKLSVFRELQNVRIFHAVAADPHIALVVDVDAVIGFRPLVALPRTAPGPDQVSGGIEHEHRRCTAAALAHLELQGLFVVVERGRAAMNDPHVVLLVDPYPDGRPEQPMIRQRLRP